MHRNLEVTLFSLLNPPNSLTRAGAVYVPCQADTIDIYTARVTREYLTDPTDPENPSPQRYSVTRIPERRSPMFSGS